MSEELLDQLFAPETIAKGYQKSDIDQMMIIYKSVFGKSFDKTCMRCVSEAWDELKIYYLSKKNPIMAKAGQRFIMNPNALLDIAGTFYNADTMTDEVVLKFLSQHTKGAMEVWLSKTFKHYPENWSEMVSSFVATGEVPEKAEAITSNSPVDLSKSELRKRIQKNSNEKLLVSLEMYPKEEWENLSRKERIEYLVTKSE